MTVEVRSFENGADAADNGEVGIAAAAIRPFAANMAGARCAQRSNRNHIQAARVEEGTNNP
jgi:hypothetical protein